MDLFIVESPLQLLCAFEAIKKNSGSDYKLLLRKTQRGLNDVHLINCAKFLKLEYSTFLLRTEHTKLDFLKNSFLWFKLYKNDYNTIYFGSFYSSFLRTIKKLLRNENIIYLDDGAATLRAQKDILEKKSLCVDWFTFFNINKLDSQKVIYHNFDYLKKIVVKSNINSSYFIGQPVHVMTNFSKDDYIRCLSEVAKKFTRTTPLIYIPHRVEDTSFIKHIPNIKVLTVDLPIELFFLQSHIDQPYEIYSHYSTALITLKKIFPSTNVVAIRNKCDTENSSNITELYKYFTKDNIAILSL